MHQLAWRGVAWRGVVCGVVWCFFSAQRSYITVREKPRTRERKRQAYFATKNVALSPPPKAGGGQRLCHPRPCSTLLGCIHRLSSPPQAVLTVAGDLQQHPLHPRGHSAVFGIPSNRMWACCNKASCSGASRMHIARGSSAIRPPQTCPLAMLRDGRKTNCSGH